MADAFIKILGGPRQGLNVPLSLTDPLIVGRKRGDLILNDPLASGKHAKIYPRDNGWFIQDLNSTNGTLVDGRLIREAALRPGVEITIGNTRMALFIGLEAARDNANNTNVQTTAARLEIAWLLEEELIELEHSSNTRNATDIIDKHLRLPPGTGAMVEVVNGQDSGKVFRLTSGNITIGRKTGEVPLTDLEVSRRHSIIELFGRDMIFLRDLDSTNGTFHNGRKVAFSRLQNGDTIGVGRSTMRIRLSNS